MRRMATLVALALLMLVAPMAMGAKLTMKVTPNPGGTAETMEAKGTWEVAKGETFVKITFETALKDSAQFSTVDGTLAKSKWSAKLILGAATYTPTKAVLHFTDAAGKPRNTSVVVTTDIVVK